MNAPTGRWWDCPLDVVTLASDAVECALDGARALAAARGADVEFGTSPALVAASFASLEHLRIDGEAVPGWAELSGFFPAADGWVRLHANYRHHAEALRSTFAIRDREGLERELATRRAADIEGQVTAAGGIAVQVRDRATWARHPQALARAGRRWVEIDERGAREPLPPAPPPQYPAAGVRILDLTRAIAGPTATQVLACLGADVLRVDPPHLVELEAQHLSTGMGKRSAILDLRQPAELAMVRELAATADVIITGYRPGALERHGLGPAGLAKLAPHAVIAVLSAWGDTGPWGARPGFDSIVQAATGIGVACGDGHSPGALPVQALDHASGHMLAGRILHALASASAATIRVSLLGAAATLLALPAPPTDQTVDRCVPRVEAQSGDTLLSAVPPPITIAGRTIEHPVGAYGAAEPRWR